MGRFTRSEGLGEWFPSPDESAWFDTDAEQVDADCSSGRPAMGDYRDGLFVCWERGLQKRLTWTDPERHLGGELISRTRSLGDLYRLWRTGPS